MKSSILFCAFVLLTINLTAQTHPITDLKSKIEAISHDDNFDVSSHPNHHSIRFDNNDILDSVYFWSWYENNWVLSSGQFITTDLNGNIITVRSSTVDSSGWNDLFQNHYIYDANNNLTHDILQEWNGSAWINLEQSVYTYDSNSDLTTDTKQNWNGTSWDNIYLLEYTYDSQHNQLTRQSNIWIGTEWSPGTKHSFTYDLQNRVTVQLVQSWISEWTNSQQLLYTYDTNGDLEMVLNQLWNVMEWDDNYRNLYAHDSNHNRISIVRQDFVAGEWINMYQYMYTYDAFNNITLLLSQFYNLDEWIDQDRFIATYDVDQNRLTEVYQFHEQTWYNVDSTYYFYTLVSSNKELQPDIPMNIFPNPSYGSIHIELEHANVSATLVNAMGQVVWTSNDISETSFMLQVAELPKGLYIFRVHDDDATYAHKLIFE